FDYVSFIFTVRVSSDPVPSAIYTLSLHDALPIFNGARAARRGPRGSSGQADDHHLDPGRRGTAGTGPLRDHRHRRRPDLAHLHRSEEHTSELQSPDHLVCRLLLEKKKTNSDPVLP